MRRSTKEWFFFQIVSVDWFEKKHFFGHSFFSSVGGFLITGFAILQNKNRMHIFTITLSILWPSVVQNLCITKLISLCYLCLSPTSMNMWQVRYEPFNSEQNQILNMSQVMMGLLHKVCRNMLTMSTQNWLWVSIYVHWTAVSQLCLKWQIIRVKTWQM